LTDPGVEVAVLETARGGLMRAGLGYDWADIGILTNIQPDHIGQNGIKSVDDLVRVKSLVLQRVREGGVVVLNADDDRVAALAHMVRAQSSQTRIVYFTLDPTNPWVRAHTGAGGSAYVAADGWIIEALGATRHHLIQVDAIPITLGGVADFQVANVLAAIAATRAYGVSGHSLACALTSFGQADHPGRANLYEVGGGYLMVDYGHNPDAIEKMGRLAARWPASRVTGVVSAPGDRVDSLIETVGRTAARHFDRLIVREDQDRRGRASGEVAEMLCRAIQSEAPAMECRTILDECEALTGAVRSMQDGELVVVFYDNLDAIREALSEVGATPAQVTRLARRTAGERQVT